MSAYPSLPLFTDAFIADTGHLSAQETGAYLMLLMVAWRSPECRLPDDDDRLGRWARVDRRTWLRIKPTVMEFWALVDGFWSQKRLTKEREIVSKRAEVARENGQHGGRPKLLISNDLDNPAGSPRATHGKAPNPNPNPKEARQAGLEPEPAAEPSPAAPASDLKSFEALCRHALVGADPPKGSFAPMAEILNGGADPDRVAGILKAEAAERPKPVGLWSLWATIVLERLAEEPKPQARASPPPMSNGRKVETVGFGRLSVDYLVAERDAGRWKPGYELQPGQQPLPERALERVE